VIEKHIAVSKSTPGSQDCLVSCDGNDLPEMVNSIRRIEKALGTGRKSPAQKELLSRDWARKSVVARVEIKKGEVITAEMLTLKRPGTGISPEQINELIGRKARTDLAADSLVPPYFLD
jgi:sialic acid synthase SpsE